jgi:5'-phosphate synthase pdxT subunit
VPRIGVLALQGDVSEHILAMQKAMQGIGEVLPVRKPGIIPDCSGLVLPGGESTTISHQLESSGMT